METDNHLYLPDFKAPKTDTALGYKKKSCNDSDNDSNSGPESAFEECNSAPEDSRAFKGKKRRKRMSSFDLKTRTELLAYANQQKLQGKYDMAEFIVNQGPHVAGEVLTTAWEMNMVQEKLDRLKKSCIEILEEATQGECAPGCNGQWLTCATEVLKQNGIRKD